MKYKLRWVNAEVNKLLFPDNPNTKPDAARKRVDRAANAEELLLEAKLAIQRETDQPTPPPDERPTTPEGPADGDGDDDDVRPE